MSCKLHIEYPLRVIRENGTVVHAMTKSKFSDKTACGWPAGYNGKPYSTIKMLEKNTVVTCKRCLAIMDLYKATERVGEGELFVLVEKESGFFYRTGGSTSWTANITDAALYKTEKNAMGAGEDQLYVPRTSGKPLTFDEYIRLTFKERQGYEPEYFFNAKKYEVRKVVLNILNNVPDRKRQ